MKKNIRFLSTGVAIIMCYLCLGCASLAQRMVTDDWRTRDSAKKEYSRLSAHERLAVQQELTEIAKDSTYENEKRITAAQVLDDVTLAKSILIDISKEATCSDGEKLAIAGLLEDRRLSQGDHKLSQLIIADVVKSSRYSWTVKGYDRAKRRLPYTVKNENRDYYIKLVEISHNYVGEGRIFDCYAFLMLEKIDDLTILADIIRNARRPLIRNVAKVRFEELLDYVFLNRKDISSQDYFEIVNYDFIPQHTRIAMIKKIVDKPLLIEIAKNAKDVEGRLEAIKRLDDEATLDELALNEQVNDIRAAAVAKVDDQNVLANIAQKDVNPSIRMLAIEKLLDQKVLCDIALNEQVNDIRAAAVAKVDDQNVLANIAQKDVNPSIRMLAIEKLLDQKVLCDIALNEQVNDIRAAAVAKVREQSVLKQIACDGENEQLCALALEHITDINPLAEVAMTASINAVRHAALQKLPLDIQRKIEREIPINAELLDVTAGGIESGVYYIDIKNHILDANIHIQEGANVTIFLCGNSIEDSDIFIETGASLTLKQGCLFDTSKGVANTHAGREFFEVRNKGTLILEDMQVRTRVINHGMLTLRNTIIGNAKTSLDTALKSALTNDASSEMRKKLAQKSLNNPLRKMREIFEDLRGNDIDVIYSGVDNYGSCQFSERCVLETFFNKSGAQCTMSDVNVSIVYNDSNAIMTLKNSVFGGIANQGETTLENVVCCSIENAGKLICSKVDLNELQNDAVGQATLIACILRTRINNASQIRWFGKDPSRDALQRNKGGESKVSNSGVLLIRDGNICNSWIENMGRLTLSGMIKAEKVRLNALGGVILGSETTEEGVYVPYTGERIVVVNDVAREGDSVVSLCLPKKFVARLHASLYAKEVPALEELPLVDLKVFKE